MTNINTVSQIINLYQSIKELEDNLSEIDVQILFVEQVIKIAGWDIMNPREVKRASRAKNKNEFDIEVYDLSQNQPKLKIAVECKSLKSIEFNIQNIDNKNGIGAFKKDVNKKVWSQIKSKDGVAQIRRYCVHSAHFKSALSLAVLTNGYDWIIFNNKYFLNKKLFERNIDQRHILSQCNLDDDNFYNKIIVLLQKTT